MVRQLRASTVRARHKKDVELNDHRLKMGRRASWLGIRLAMAEYDGYTRSKIKYWMKKAKHPEWKRHPHGGRRRAYSIEDTSYMVAILRFIVDRRPSTPYKVYKDTIRHYLGIVVSLTWIKDTFRDVGWTYVFKRRVLDAVVNSNAHFWPPDGRLQRLSRLISITEPT